MRGLRSGIGIEIEAECQCESQVRGKVPQQLEIRGAVGPLKTFSTEVAICVARYCYGFTQM